MSSKDRKYSSKEYSTKNRSAENESYDKTHKNSSSKHRGEKVESTNSKQVAGDKNNELEYKYKINKDKGDENERRIKEESRRRAVKDELIKIENESDKKRRHHTGKVDESNEEKRHRRANEEENGDRRKSKIEYKDEMEKTRDNGERRHHRREYEDDSGDKRKKRTETKEEYDKGRHRTEKDNEYNDERRRHRREYEDDNADKRKKKTETKEDYEKGRKRTEKGDESNEMRKHHRRENEEDNEKRKARESKDERGKAKQKNDKRDEGQKFKESEISQDGDKLRHRSKKVESEDGEDISKKRRSKEKENVAFLDGKDDSVTLKVRSDGDREYEHKRRGNRENNKDEVHKENYESKSYNTPNNRTEEFDYDDDFENYGDEEFEEDSPEISPVSNEPAVSDQSSGISQVSKQSEKPSIPIARSEISKPTTNIGKINSSFINFKIAQKKYSHDLVANRMLSRAYDLSKLIEMDKEEYDIFELAPVVEHSQYMQLFGKQGCQHEGSQTGSDNIARESQTEYIEERIVWTQCPPLDDSECFQVVSDFMGPSASMTKIVNDTDSRNNEKFDNSLISVLMIPTLTMFENILEEETTCEIAVKVSGSHDHNNKQTISSGYSKYAISDGLDCLIGRFAVSNSNMFVTVHPPSKSATPISVWKVSGNNNEPYMYLSCPGISETQSSISCVTFSPDPAASHIICGLSTGAIVLWDLKDNKSNRKCLLPAYLTSMLGEENDAYHVWPIVGMQPVNNGLSTANSYQLISLDSCAQLIIWMVSLVSQYNQWSLEYGSPTDLHLRPGARYRMSKVTSLCLVSSSYITSMTLDPSCSTHLFCGTDSGQIALHTRANHSNSDTRPSARSRTMGQTDQYESGAVTQLDFYPFFEPYLLAGYDDGLIQIFSVGKSKSLLSFHYKHHMAILQLKWSRSHPAIFFSFDVEGNLCVWNVLTDLYNPVHVQTLPGYIGFDLSSDSKWQTIQNETMLPMSTFNRARLLLWALDGRVEVHELSDAFSNPDLDVSCKTCSLFQSLI